MTLADIAIGDAREGFDPARFRRLAPAQPAQIRPQRRAALVFALALLAPGQAGAITADRPADALSGPILSAAHR